MPDSIPAKPYWRRNLRITAFLLMLWFAVTFAIDGFAAEMNFDFFGWPFSFWMASQGALLLYCLIIWAYGAYMNRLDQAEQTEAESD